MAYILCLETATTNCSVVLSKDGKVIAIKEDNSKEYTHAERLHVFIEEVLHQAGITKAELDAIAVSKGPGSYTGLRIGVSAAKGLCYGLDIPLISIPTLQSLAFLVTKETEYIIPMIDARRMEVYAAVFDSSKKEVRETKAEILHKHSFDEFLTKGSVVFIGNGAMKFEAICDHKNAYFLTSEMPSAQQMAPLAFHKYKISDIENVAYFEPYYLKDFMIG